MLSQPDKFLRKQRSMAEFAPGHGDGDDRRTVRISQSILSGQY